MLQSFLYILRKLALSTFSQPFNRKIADYKRNRSVSKCFILVNTYVSILCNLDIVVGTKCIDDHNISVLESICHVEFYPVMKIDAALLAVKSFFFLNKTKDWTE